jgi:hypothetical protein
VVEALVVIFQSWGALLLAGLALAGVHDVASKNLLPEGVAAGGTWGEMKQSQLRNNSWERGGSSQGVTGKATSRGTATPSREGSEENIPPLRPCPEAIVKIG